MDAKKLENHYDELSEAFFDLYYTYYPVHATRQGLHQYDSSLGHFRRLEIEQTLLKMKSIQEQVHSINPAEMGHVHALDHPVLSTRIKREIYWIEKWRFWENNPLFYIDVITEGIFNLESRNFAPLEQRLINIIKRQKNIPEVLQAARENLLNPPIEYTNQAIDHVIGAQKYFEHLPDSFNKIADSVVMQEFMKTNLMTIKELSSFLEFLKNDLFFRSKGDFAVGEAGIQAILDAEEMIDSPVQKLLDYCYKKLKETEEAFQEQKCRIDPAMTVDSIIKKMYADHVMPEHLYDAINEELKKIRSVLSDYNIITVPKELPEVIVTAMPDYSNGGGMMSTPGPFEQVAKESFLALQIPKAGWKQEQIDGLWSDFNSYALTLLMIHECYPGHHFQFFMEKQVLLRASKDHDSDSNSDGWAEYAKMMLVDEVYEAISPYYRLASLLSRRSYIAASIAGLEIHLKRKTLEEASNFLMEKQGRTKANTYIWVLNRATYYPTHLTYFIGCEMVWKLRHDYQKKMGSNFNLKEFHDKFMTYGLIPIKIIRQDMLQESDDGVLF